jgi:hypothetical protein
MKLKVVADKSGKILATFRPSGGKNNPTSVRIQVEGGHEHELEVQDELLAPGSVHKLHTEYRVDVTGQAPKLVKAH